LLSPDPVDERAFFFAPGLEILAFHVVFQIICIMYFTVFYFFT